METKKFASEKSRKENKTNKHGMIIFSIISVLDMTCTLPMLVFLFSHNGNWMIKGMMERKSENFDDVAFFRYL